MAHRILRGAPATLTYTHLDANGSRATAPAAVTVGVTRADGSTLIASGTATTEAAGVYTFALTPAQTTTLDVLTATWSITGVPGASRQTSHEIVGGFLFSLDALASKSGLQGYDQSDMLRARAEVEDECEWITDIAWVPRYQRLVLNGTGEDTILTQVRAIRTIRSVRIYPVVGVDAYTSLTAGQIAGLVRSPDGMLRRTDGDVWRAGFGNVVLEVEHGLNEPYPDIAGAALDRCQDLLLNPDSAIPPRARSYSDTATGISYDLADADKMRTGLPRVDAVYLRRSFRSDASTEDSATPASRTLNYDPQFYGIFRGGRT